MQNISKIIIGLAAITDVAFCEIYESFFMSDEDSRKAILLAKQYGTVDSSNNVVNFKLSGIFFIDEMNWTIWLNGIPYSDAGQHGNFSIDEVSETEVVITRADGESLTLSVE